MIVSDYIRGLNVTTQALHFGPTGCGLYFLGIVGARGAKSDKGRCARGKNAPSQNKAPKFIEGKTSELVDLKEEALASETFK